ncbi:MAG: BPTD_2524 family lipoprotein [Dyella sp.]
MIRIHVMSAALLVAGLSGCASVRPAPRPDETFFVGESVQQVYYRLNDWVRTCHSKDQRWQDIDVQGTLYTRSGKAYVSFSQQGQNLLNVGLSGTWSNTSVVASVLGQGPWNRAELTAIKQSLQHGQVACAASGE